MKIVDLARIIAPDCEQREIGIRPGEKIHEVMIPLDDGRLALEFDEHFIIQPSLSPWRTGGESHADGSPCRDGFYYGSDNNTAWLEGDRLAAMIAELDIPEAREWAAEQPR
jgi:UDP-N-acetylglucosamine 4,6-dehydratase